MNPKGLLRLIVYADLFGLTEGSATAVLLGALVAEKRPSSTDEHLPFPGVSSTSDDYQEFLDHVPSNIKKGSANSDAAKRLELAKTIVSLRTNQVNLLVYSLNPPDNEIPPVSAIARDRAAALLDWASRERIDLSVIEDLVNTLKG